MNSSALRRSSAVLPRRSPADPGFVGFRDWAGRAPNGTYAHALSAGSWKVWRRLRLRALADDPVYAPVLETELRFDALAWRAQLSEPRSVRLAGGRQDFEPAGIAAVFVSDGERTAEIYSLWVEPASRGSGVAAALIEAAAAWALAEACDALVLKVFPTNAVALRLYDRARFTRTGYTGVHDVSGLPEIEMLRLLG